MSDKSGIDVVYEKVDEWLNDKIMRWETVDGVYRNPPENSTYATRKAILKREIALLQSVKTIIKQECFSKKEGRK